MTPECPSKDEFAVTMTEAWQAADPDANIVFDSKSFSLTHAGKELLLNNCYAEYCGAPQHGRQRIVKEFVLATIGCSLAGPSKDEVRKLLLPRVRDRWWHEARVLRDRARGQSLSIPTQPLADHLTLEVVVEEPDVFRSVSSEQLIEWELTFDEALAIAREKLMRVSVTGGFKLLAPGLYRSAWNDSSDASRLILHDVLRRLPVKGKHVAMIPACDMLLLTGSDDTAGLLKMVEIAEARMKQPRAMTGLPVILEGNAWKTWYPSDDHPAYIPLSNLITRCVSSEYNEQKELLDAIHEREGIDACVASHMVGAVAADMELVTVSYWAKGQDTLLPKTNFIFLGERDGKHLRQIGVAFWYDVRSICADCFEVQDIYPPRYRAKRFPSDEQIAALRFFPMKVAVDTDAAGDQ